MKKEIRVKANRDVYIQDVNAVLNLPVYREISNGKEVVDESGNIYRIEYKTWTSGQRVYWTGAKAK